MQETCAKCGSFVGGALISCKCGHQRTHQEIYPEQYSHPLVGKTVIAGREASVKFVVQRVCSSRFGQIAMMDDNKGYVASTCKVVS